MPTATPDVIEQTETQDRTDVAAPWNVVVHNDPITLMSYVTLVFRRVFQFTKEKATKHMLEVHHRGRSVVWSGGRERAEFYVQQLHTHQLLSTLERAE